MFFVVETFCSNKFDECCNDVDIFATIFKCVLDMTSVANMRWIEASSIDDDAIDRILEEQWFGEFVFED